MHPGRRRLVDYRRKLSYPGGIVEPTRNEGGGGGGTHAMKFERIAPIVPVRDLDAALERYRRLGFTTQAYDGPDRYAFVDRDSVSLHLTEWPDHDPLRTAASVYLYVDDADAVHAEW